MAEAAWAAGSGGLMVTSLALMAALSLTLWMKWDVLSANVTDREIRELLGDDERH